MGSGKRFAEALDLSVVVLLAAASAVAASGGVRWEPFGLRLSMTSPSRAVLLAGLLVLVRWWRAPGAPLHRWLARPLARLRQPSIPGTESSILNSQFSILNSPSPLRTWRGEWVWVPALFLALTALMTWQQLASPYAVGDTGDPLFSIWRLSWVAHQLPRDPLRLFDANIFYPELRTLAYSDAMLATALLAAPLLWLGVHQILVYNIVLLVSFAASGVAMYALARELTGDRAAAFVAGVAFAFYPFRFEHYSHLELQMTFWMPLALLMMHRTMRTGRARDGAVTGLLAALQTLSSLYCGLFLLVVMGVVWLATGGLRPGGRRLVPWLVAAAVLVVLVLPIAVPYLENRGQLGERPDWEARIYSATPRSYVVAHVRSRFYGGLLDGPRMPEASLFPGIAVVALALAGAWPRLTRSRAAYALAALVAFDGSLGLNGIVFPTLRDALLPFRGLRVPARFSILVGLSLSVLAGYGVQRLRQSSWLKGGRLGTVLPVACAAVLLVENVPNLDADGDPGPAAAHLRLLRRRADVGAGRSPVSREPRAGDGGRAAPLLFDVPLADADHRQQRVFPRVVQTGGQDAAGRADGARRDVPPGARRPVHRAQSRRLRGLGGTGSRSSISTRSRGSNWCAASAARATTRRCTEFGREAEFGIENSEFRIPNSQFSILNSQFSISDRRPSPPSLLHHSTRARSRRRKTKTPARPATKPATCAQNAIPPWFPAVCAIEPAPLNSCIRNQKPRKKMAGISMISMKMKSGISVSTRECG